MAARNRFSPGRGLDARIAAGPARRRVEQVTAQVEQAVKAAAPDAKVWVTREDERVRNTHVHAHEQTIPENLRYQIPKPRGNDGRADSGGVDLAREPRDPALPIGQRINCRCLSLPLLDAIARTVTASDAVVRGAEVTAQVSARFRRLTESEYPDTPDRGGGWMRGAARDVASRR